MLFCPAFSIANKATGCVLFVLPLTLTVVEITYRATIACAIATFAALQKGHYILRSDNSTI